MQVRSPDDHVKRVNTLGPLCLWQFLERTGPIDRTQGTPGSDKNILSNKKNTQNIRQLVIRINFNLSHYVKENDPIGDFPSKKKQPCFAIGNVLCQTFSST